MIALSTEEKLVILLSRFNRSAEVLKEAKGLMAYCERAFDCDKIIDLASANGVLSFLYYGVRDLPVVPERAKNRFENAYLHVLKNNLVQAQEMMRILKSLGEHSVDVIPLKGVVASENIFGDPGLYMSTDMDILVRSKDLPVVGEVLAEMGYQKNEGISETDLASSHYHLIFQNGNQYVEVHWNLVKRYFQIPEEFWWKDRRKTLYADMEISELSVERYIMYGIFRLFDHGFRPLKFFVFIDGLINKHKDGIDWGRLLELSRRYKMERLTVFTLRLTREILGADLPDSITNRSVTGYNALKNMIVAGLLRGVSRPHLRMTLYATLLENPMEYSKVISRRIFPELGEIRLRYGLPAGSTKAYVYYLLNPFLILLKNRR